MKKGGVSVCFLISLEYLCMPNFLQYFTFHNYIVLYFVFMFHVKSLEHSEKDRTYYPY